MPHPGGLALSPPVVARYAERLTGRGGSSSALVTNNGIYLYPKKIVYKEKKNGVFITKFSGVSLNALLESPVVDFKIKSKIREIMSRFS